MKLSLGGLKNTRCTTARDLVDNLDHVMADLLIQICHHITFTHLAGGVEGKVLIGVDALALLHCCLTSEVGTHGLAHDLKGRCL